MVNTGFRDARLDIPDPPPAQSAANQQDEENMDARPDGASRQQIPAAVGEARDEGLEGPGHPAATLSQLPKPAQGSSSSMSMTNRFVQIALNCVAAPRNSR